MQNEYGQMSILYCHIAAISAVIHLNGSLTSDTDIISVPLFGSKIMGFFFSIHKRPFNH